MRSANGASVSRRSLAALGMISALLRRNHLGALGRLEAEQAVVEPDVGLDLAELHFADAAERMWERALQVDPRDPRTIGYLARVHEQMARAREISEDAP